MEGYKLVYITIIKDNKNKDQAKEVQATLGSCHYLRQGAVKKRGGDHRS